MVHCDSKHSCGSKSLNGCTIPSVHVFHSTSRVGLPGVLFLSILLLLHLHQYCVHLCFIQDRFGVSYLIFGQSSHPWLTPSGLSKKFDRLTSKPGKKQKKHEEPVWIRSTTSLPLSLSKHKTVVCCIVLRQSV